MPAAKRTLAKSDQGAARLSDAFFGPPPLLGGEDNAAYAALLKQVRDGVAPDGVIEDIWVRDVVDITWEILRQRRFKTLTINAAYATALRSLIEPRLSYEDKKSLADRWEARDAAARKDVARHLARFDLSVDDVNARACVLKLDVIERLDRMIAQAEARRNLVLREVERRRDALARRLRDSVADVQDAEFTEVGDRRLGVYRDEP